MQIKAYPKEFFRVARLQRSLLSPEAAERLRWVIAWQSLRQQGYSAQAAAELLQLSRASLYRWQARLQRQGLKALEPRSRRPKRVRQPSWSFELAQTVLDLRRHYPRWGKDKLLILLRREGFETSASTVGRILASQKRRGLLIETPSSYVRKRTIRPRRPYAGRKPPDYPPQLPGDLVQVDTMDLRPWPNKVLKHFSARDVASRWDVLEVHTRATAATAAQFLDSLQRRAPFPIRAIQVDGGSEFQADFERACQAKGIQLFVLPPHSPKLNGFVERAHRTHQEEFYQVYAADLQLEPLNQALQAWEHTYNTVRPHQSLDGMTPAEYIQAHYPQVIPKSSHMS